MRPDEEIKHLINLARDCGMTQINIDGVTFFIPQPKEEKEPSDIRINKIIEEMPYSDEEIKYWHSDYFDEIQILKQQREALNGEENKGRAVDLDSDS